MRTAKGINTRRRRRVSWVMRTTCWVSDFMGDSDELVDFGDIADIGAEVN